LRDPNGEDDLLLEGNWGTLFGIIMYFLPTFPVLQLKRILMDLAGHRWRDQWTYRGVPGTRPLRMFGKNWERLLHQRALLPGANGGIFICQGGEEQRAG